MANDVDSKEVQQVNGETPPPRDGEINNIPKLSTGDKVRVVTKGDYDPDRTLTVSNPEPEGDDFLDLIPKAIWGMDGGPAYILEGYGTRYLLATRGTRHWRGVFLTWPSHRYPESVTQIEVHNAE